MKRGAKILLTLGIILIALIIFYFIFQKKSFSGYVYDANTKQPIKEAKVLVESVKYEWNPKYDETTVYTNDKGKFKTKMEYRNLYRVEIIHEDYNRYLGTNHINNIYSDDYPTSLGEKVGNEYYLINKMSTVDLYRNQWGQVIGKGEGTLEIGEDDLEITYSYIENIPDSSWGLFGENEYISNKKIKHTGEGLIYVGTYEENLLKEIGEAPLEGYSTAEFECDDSIYIFKTSKGGYGKMALKCTEGISESGTPYVNADLVYYLNNNGTNLLVSTDSYIPTS